jgi:hypothetical protein
MVFITLAVLGLAAVFAHLTGERLVLRRLSRESTGWPRVAGVVVDTGTVWSSSPRSGRSYWPRVRYRYAVDGKAYVGDRVSFRADYARADVESAVRRYPAGSAVSVSYSPGDPRRSVLEPGTWHDGRLMTVLVPLTVAAIMAVLFAAAVLVLVSKPRR